MLHQKDFILIASKWYVQRHSEIVSKQKAVLARKSKPLGLNNIHDILLNYPARQSNLKGIYIHCWYFIFIEVSKGSLPFWQCIIQKLSCKGLLLIRIVDRVIEIKSIYTFKLLCRNYTEWILVIYSPVVFFQINCGPILSLYFSYNSSTLCHR